MKHGAHASGVLLAEVAADSADFVMPFSSF